MGVGVFFPQRKRMTQTVQVGEPKTEAARELTMECLLRGVYIYIYIIISNIYIYIIISNIYIYGLHNE